MWVRTREATPSLGMVTDWAADGSSITVDAWTQPAAAGIPAGGVGSVLPTGTATIGALDNIYGVNTNVYCDRPGMVQCSGGETVVFNQTGGYQHGGPDPRGDLPLMDGSHAFCNGPAGSFCSSAYAAYPGTSQFQYGFTALSGARGGFYWYPVGTSGAGFVSGATSGLMAVAYPAGINRWAMAWNGIQNGYNSAGINTYGFSSDDGSARLTGRLGLFNAAGTNQQIYFDGQTGSGQINGTLNLRNATGLNQNILLEGETGNVTTSGAVNSASVNTSAVTVAGSTTLNGPSIANNLNAVFQGFPVDGLGGGTCTAGNTVYVPDARNPAIDPAGSPATGVLAYCNNLHYWISTIDGLPVRK